MTVLTLLTDFGLRDGYVGVMKGVIYKIIPTVQIADISHAIPPQNILLGALALARTSPFFPSGCVHVGVVDPGVGTHRRPIAGQVGEQFFVGPDNGLFTILIKRAFAQDEQVKIIHLDQPDYWLQDVSNVFHGRDIFAPCGAYLAAGTHLEQMGTLIDDPVLLDISEPEPLENGGWRGEIMEVDFFGNLSTNIERKHLAGNEPVNVKIGDTTIDNWVNTFGERPVGSLISLYGTADDLVISVVNGNAARRLEVGVGEAVEVFPKSSKDDTGEDAS